MYVPKNMELGQQNNCSKRWPAETLAASVGPRSNLQSSVGPRSNPFVVFLLIRTFATTALCILFPEWGCCAGHGRRSCIEWRRAKIRITAAFSSTASKFLPPRPAGLSANTHCRPAACNATQSDIGLEIFVELLLT